MKWDESTRYLDGSVVRHAYFDASATTRYRVTDYNGKRLVLRVDHTDEKLAEATPTRRGRKWLVQITGGKPRNRKHQHIIEDTKEDAVDAMLAYETFYTA